MGVPVTELPVLADQLKRLCEGAGQTRGGLAAATGLNVSMVARLEQRQQVDPRLSTLRALARALGVTVSDLPGDVIPPPQGGPS